MPRTGFASGFRNGGWDGGRGDGGWGGWRGGDWDDGDGGWNWGLGAGLAGFALAVTFGNPYWSPYWSPYWDPYWGAPYGPYWAADYGVWDPGYDGYWAPDYVGYWDEPYYVDWSAPYYDYGYPYWRPRLWRHYRRPLEAVSDGPVQPAVYTVAVQYDVPANCGGAHYVWDDYVGGYVYRPYGFPC